VFANHGIEVQGYAHDTMLQSYVLEVHKPHGLASLAERHLGRSGISFEDLCGKGAQPDPSCTRWTWPRPPTTPAKTPSMTLQVHRRVVAAAAGRRRAARSSTQLEIASSEALYRIERNGVLIDAPTLAAQSHELGPAHRAAGDRGLRHSQASPSTWAAPSRLAKSSSPSWACRWSRKPPPARRSTDEEVLEKLAEDYPLPAKILEHRGLAKLKGTYTDKLAQLAHAAHRPRAHPLRAGGGGDRAPVQQRPEPAEHPDPHRRGPPRARGLCGAVRAA